MATMKKISRKELGQDEFIERVFDLGEWLEANWQKAVAIAGASLLVVLAVAGVTSWRNRSLARANAELGLGLLAYEPSAGADGTAPPPRYTEALAAFAKAADLGGSRPVGQIASYYRALTLVALNRAADAVPELEGLASSSGPIQSQAKVSLANALADRGDYDRAASLLQEVAQAPRSSFPPDSALSMLGALRARQGKNDEARRAYEDLLAKYPQSPHATDARQRATELGAPGTLPATSSATTR